jgi:hypothetical protein
LVTTGIAGTRGKKELALVLKVATSISTRSNNHRSIDQTMENSEIQIYYSKTIKFRTWEFIINSNLELERQQQ